MPNQYASIEDAAANQYNLNRTWFESLGQIESNQIPSATSPAGAQGLYQIMPANDAALGITNPYDPTQSAMGGAKLFSQYLAAAGGNYTLATEYYNCGPGNVCAAGAAEAGKVATLANSVSGYLNNIGLGPNATAQQQAAFNQSPAGQVLQQTDVVSATTSLLPRAGIIAAGVILVILAMVIPNRETVLKLAK